MWMHFIHGCWQLCSTCFYTRAEQTLHFKHPHFLWRRSPFQLVGKAERADFLHVLQNMHSIQSKANNRYIRHVGLEIVSLNIFQKGFSYWAQVTRNSKDFTFVSVPFKPERVWKQGTRIWKCLITPGKTNARKTVSHHSLMFWDCILGWPVNSLECILR